MKIFRLLIIIFTLSVVFTDYELLTAQNRPGPKLQCEENFIKADTDKDGKVSLKEFMAIEHHKNVSPENLFKSKDTNGDGFLSKDEFCSKGGGMGNRPGRKKY